MTAHPTVDDVLLIQGSGPHVDLTPVEKEVIVDLHCGAAVLRGADIFVPGVRLLTLVSFISVPSTKKLNLHLGTDVKTVLLGKWILICHCWVS